MRNDSPLTRGCGALLAVLLAGAGAVSAGSPTVAAHPEPVADHYIVTLRAGRAVPSVSEAAQSLAGEYGGQVTFVYEHALQGFAVRMDEKRARSLAADGRVAAVEQVGRVYPDDVQSPAPWGLDRIDQRLPPLDNAYNYRYTGAGVHVYVIDTGIRATHQEFAGRMGPGVTFVNDGNGTSDCNGHGTHVAGTVGGTTYGVAKGATLHPVRVFPCFGGTDTSVVIAAVDWVTANRVDPAVANMSLGGSASDALDAAVNNSVASGVVHAVAAGNFAVDACIFSPARASAALTVGATNEADARAFFSNQGTCLDLFAPGVNITSAWYTGDSATNTLNGTSMASPHVAGIAALYRQQYGTASAAAISLVLAENATQGVVGDAGTGSPNRLAHSLFGLEPPRLSIGDVAFAEGPSGVVQPRVAVSLSAMSPVDVTVHYQTADCTAQAGSDYLPFSGDLTFTPGELTKHIFVNALGDHDFEASETYLVNLSAPSYATVADGRGQVTLINDDPDPDPPLGLPPADFNGDGKADILWRHQFSGQISAWFMEGINLSGGSLLAAQPDLNWTIVGTADFSFDGHTDILWRHDLSGGLAVWFMNGVTRIGEVFLAGQADPAWKIAATGDFDADGGPDILWRHDGSGALLAWLMDGTRLRSATSLSPGSVGDLGWRIAGTGDFNRDGQADILWRHQASRQLVAWLMNGVNQAQGVFLTPGEMGEGWQVSALGDFNGDRGTDILWRHQATGELLAWLMSGTSLTCAASLDPDRLADLSWTIAGPR